MLYCQSAPEDHRAAAAYALTFARNCGHEYPARTLACVQHGAQLRAQPRAEESTSCERCGDVSPLTLVRIEDVFEERLVISVARTALERSAHSPVTLAYDRAYRAAAERGLQPVTAYRMPVQWRAGAAHRPGGTEIMEACVTVAVTLPETAAYQAG